MTICIGLDAHAKTCVYRVRNEANQDVDGGTIPSTPEDLERLSREYPGATVVVEASGSTEWIYDRLVELKMKPVLCHPVNIRRTLGKKNDEIDAGFLADAYRLGCLPLSWVPPREIRALRQIARRCAFLAEEKTRYKNRIHGILKRRGIRLLDEETGEEVGAIFLKKHQAQLRAVSNPEVPCLLETLEHLCEQRSRLDAELEKAVQRFEGVRNLLTIPGFGALTAVGIYAEIGDASRFADADSVAAYFGLVPKESQSGETLIRSHITKRGSPTARWLLNQAAWVHVTSCPKSSLSKDYRRLSKRIGKKRAITTVMRKLAKVSYWLLRENRSFTMNGQG